VTAKVLPASFDRTLVRLLVGVDRSHMPLQMLAASEALVASVDHALVHPHVLLHTTLYHEHWCRRHTSTAGLLREVRHGHGRTEPTWPDRAHATVAAAQAHAAGAS